MTIDPSEKRDILQACAGHCASAGLFLEKSSEPFFTIVFIASDLE